MGRKYFTFRIYGGGYGETVEEAWSDCQEHFDINEEPQPTTYSEEEVDDNE